MSHGLRSAFLAGLAAATLLQCDGSSFSPTVPDGANTVIGSGNVVAESRSVGGFDGVDLDGVGNVELQPAAVESLTIEADDNLLPFLRSEVVGGVLVLSTRPGMNLRPSRPIRYLVTARQMLSARLSGVGEIVCVGLATPRLTLQSTGVGTLRFTRLNAQRLDVTSSGEGQVVTSGGVDRQRVLLSGVVEYHARGLRTAETEIELGGLATATVRVRDRLTAHLGGQGCLYYLGDPVLEVTGEGCLEKIQ